MAERDEGFAARWSRRKLESRDEVAEPELAELAEQESEPETKVAALTPAADVPLPDLPSVESLAADSDFKPFLQEGVPEDLRRLALRKMWRLTAPLPDGLNDYDEDFSMIGKVAMEVSTLFRPGKGMADPDPPPDEIDFDRVAAIEPQTPHPSEPPAESMEDAGEAETVSEPVQDRPRNKESGPASDDPVEPERPIPDESV